MKHTDIFDDQLKKIDHYDRYPELMPFIGNYYGKTSIKLLFIGESHYLPKASDAHLDPKKWYGNYSSDLLTEERLWINTRRIVNNIHGAKPPKAQKWKKSRTIYRNIELAMMAAGYPYSENHFCNVAFMNAFQRPAENTGGSINVTPIDVTIASDVINTVISIIEPNYVVFLSSKASKFISKTIRHTSSVTTFSHPASPWWNRANKNGIAKENFINFLSNLIQKTI